MLSTWNSIPASTVDVQASADSDDQISLLPTCNAQAGSERDATEPPLSSSDTSLKPVANDARAGVPQPGSVPTRVAEDEVAEPIAIGSACDLLEGKSEPEESVTWAAQVAAGMDNPSDVPPPTPVGEHAVADGFTLVGKGGKPARRDRRMVSSAPTRKPGRCGSSGGLKGAQRVRCAPFYLAGISLDSNEWDIVSFCCSKNVLVTGCYLLRSRVWGTQSAKIYVDLTSKSTVLAEHFWPAHLKCREWQADAPVSRSSRPTSPSA